MADTPAPERTPEEEIAQLVAERDRLADALAQCKLDQHATRAMLIEQRDDARRDRDRLQAALLELSAREEQMAQASQRR